MDSFTLGLGIFTIAAIIIALISFFIAFFVNKKEPTKLQKDLKILEKNIDELEKQGLNEEAVVKRLSDAGWDSHVVDLVLKDLAKPSHKIEKLQEYTDEQIEKGIEKEVLKETLLDAGWDEGIVDLILKLD